MLRLNKLLLLRLWWEKLKRAILNSEGLILHAAIEKLSNEFWHLNGNFIIGFYLLRDLILDRRFSK